MKNHGHHQLDPLRAHILTLLDGEGAHLPFADAVGDFPAELRGVKPSGASHTAWQLLEHLRIALHDMLEFSTSENYTEMKWPDEYWPKTEAPPDVHAWEASIAQYQKDIEAYKALVADESRDLLTPYPPPGGKPLLRNVLVIADHNSYHIGQLVLLRKVLEGTGTSGG